MTRLLQGGAETRSTVTSELNTAPDGLPTGSGTKPTTNSANARIVHSADSRCWVCAPSASTTSYVQFGFTGVNGRKYFGRFYFRVNQLPTNTVLIGAYLNAGGGQLCSIRLTPGGKLQLWNDKAAVQIGSDSVATFAANTWYMAQLAVSVPSPVTSTGFAEAYYRLNDTAADILIASSATQNYVSSSTPGTFNVGVFSLTNLAGTQVFIDDVALNDDQGALPNNTYPGAGHVINLMPAADSSIGVWLNGAAGNTSLFDALNGGGAAARGAPGGVAPASATAASQVKDTAAGTADALDVTLDSYADQGIDVSSQITLVQPIMCFGNDSATDVTGGVQLVSNPVVSELTQAMALGNAVGTHATNWRWLKGNYSLAPTPTLATAPVLRIRKLAAAGMDADYAALVVETSPIGANKAIAPTAGLVATSTVTAALRRPASNPLNVSSVRATSSVSVFTPITYASSTVQFAVVQKLNAPKLIVASINATSFVTASQPAVGVFVEITSPPSGTLDADVAQFVATVSHNTFNSVSAQWFIDGTPYGNPVILPATQILVGDILTGTPVPSSTLSIEWLPASMGAHTVSLVVTDNLGNAFSDQIAITAALTTRTQTVLTLNVHNNS